jgi:sec-independent protein translocase protein TatC
VTVSLYAAIALSIPFLLWQIWGFISPALYRHERKYVTPFIFLSTVAFLLGASFAYYILFPPAIAYLLGVGQDFDLMLRASDYFDFIVLIMLAMGIIFQMPAVSYVLSRIGIISAPFLIKGWKIALVVILIVAAVISPTGDVPNLLLFALPMTVLYVISIFIAWLFGKERRNIPKIQ